MHMCKITTINVLIGSIYSYIHKPLADSDKTLPVRPQAHFHPVDCSL